MTAHSFDLISDIHLDFWLHEFTYLKQLSIDLFVDALLPPIPSDVLIIAGDLITTRKMFFSC